MTSEPKLTFRDKPARRHGSRVRYVVLSIGLTSIGVGLLQDGDREAEDAMPLPLTVAVQTLKLPQTEVIPESATSSASQIAGESHVTGNQNPETKAEPIALSLPFEPMVPNTPATLALPVNAEDSADSKFADTGHVGAAGGSASAGIDRTDAQPDNTDARSFAGTTPTGEWVDTRVVSGDNMSLIFNRLGLSARELYLIIESGGDAEKLTRLMPGQTIRVHKDKGRVLELTQSLDALKTLHIQRKGEHFVSRVLESVPDIQVRAVTGTIDESLFLSGQRAGLSDAVIMNLTSIFAWDVDFVLDIREGDTFSVVFNEYWIDGKKIKDGEIVAAEFINQGRTLRAIRFDLDGRSSYYSDTGRNMRKAFLRTPVNFTRISSRFNLKRKHPVLNRIRAHKGVDYAAPHGTPIRATGDGKIVFAGTKGGYGKTVQLRHGSQYSTLYAHMSRFARGIRSGATVSQGQTIGYVGQSGLATGPHLHYEFHVNGSHQDPLKVKLPSAASIPPQYSAEFAAVAQPLIAQLDSLAQNRDTEVLVATVDSQVDSRKQRSQSLGGPDS